jgi:hypothetical protein
MKPLTTKFSRVGDEDASDFVNGESIARPSGYPGAVATTAQRNGRHALEDDDLQAGMTVIVTNQDGTGASTETIEFIDASQVEPDTDEVMPLGRVRLEETSRDASV